jgi:hypothetical protein
VLHDWIQRLVVLVKGRFGPTGADGAGAGGTPIAVLSGITGVIGWLQMLLRLGRQGLRMVWSGILGIRDGILSFPAFCRNVIYHVLSLPTVRMVLRSPAGVIIGVALLLAMVITIDVVLLGQMERMTSMNDSLYRASTARQPALEEVPKAMRQVEESLNRLPLPVDKNQRKDMLRILDQIRSVSLVQIDNRLHEIARMAQERQQVVTQLTTDQQQMRLDAQRVVGVATLGIVVVIVLIGKGVSAMLTWHRDEIRQREMVLMEMLHIGTMADWHYMPPASARVAEPGPDDMEPDGDYVAEETSGMPQDMRALVGQGRITFNNHLFALLNQPGADYGTTELSADEFVRTWIDPRDGDKMLELLETALQPEHDGLIVRARIRFAQGGGEQEVRLLGATVESAALSGPLSGLVQAIHPEHELE